MDDTLAVGGSIVLYLEDDFAEPDDISAMRRLLRGQSASVEEVTGNGARVYATVDPVISSRPVTTSRRTRTTSPSRSSCLTCAATRLRWPAEGDNGLIAGDTISVVVTKGAGLKNAVGRRGTHSTGFTLCWPLTTPARFPSYDACVSGEIKPGTPGWKG